MKTWKPFKYARDKKKQIPSEVDFPFSFSKVNLNEIIKEMKNLDESKVTQSNDIPTKVIKENYEICTVFISKYKG